MDHIPQATGSPHQTVKVPFVVSKRFEDVILNHKNVYAEWEWDGSGEPFLDVTLDDNAPAERLCRTCEILDFYQARCFFGLLGDMYSLAGRELNLQVYLDRQDEKQVLVTTRNLLAEIGKIADREMLLADDAKAQKYIQLDGSIQETENLTMLLQSYVVDSSSFHSSEDGAFNQALPDDLRTVQIISESTAMLRETLLTAARQIYMPSAVPEALKPIFGRELPPAPENYLCMERFEEAGWCPRQAAETAETALKSRSVLFALSSINRKDHSSEMHRFCTTAKCALDNIDNDAHQTLHATDCEMAECPLVPSRSATGRNGASAIISRIVRKNCIPVISVIEKADSQPLLSIKSYQPSRTTNNHDLRKRKRHDSAPRRPPRAVCEEKVVKLCDVPLPQKHGAEKDKGSTEQTSPAICDVLDAEVEAADLDNRVPYIALSHVWSQGLGNRHSNALPLCQLRRLQRFADHLVSPDLRPIPFWIDTICVPLDPVTRDMAIKSMRTVYSDAVAVLVVDSTLTEFDLSRVKSEDWQGSGLRGWQIELLMRIKAAPWAQRLWTYQEACLARRLYFQVGGNEIPAVCSRDIVVGRVSDAMAKAFRLDEDQGQDEHEPERSKDVITPTALELGRLASTEAPSGVSMSQKQRFPLEYTTAYLLTEAASLQLFDRSDLEEFRDNLRYLSRQLALRTTSRLKDEAICLASLLGLEPAAVMVDTHGKTIAGGDRMKRLWEVVEPKKIPAEVLFCNRPVYGDKGIGWMVKSLLRDETGNWINHLGCGDVRRRDGNYGILVEMGGVGFEVPKVDGTVIDAGRGGGEAPTKAASPWNILLKIAGFTYKMVAVEAAECLSEWRSSVDSGRFAILMPPSELRALVESAEDRVHGSGSHSTELPFGLLVNVLEGHGIEPDGMRVDPVEHAIHVVRREMVELEIVLDESDIDDAEIVLEAAGEEVDRPNESHLDITTDDVGEVQVDTQILPETQGWWVG